MLRKVNKPRLPFRLHVEPLEYRAMLSCPSAIDCPDPSEMESHAAQNTPWKNEHQANFDTVTFFATSQSTPGASGHLSIDLQERNLRWESKDTVFGPTAISSMIPVRWDYSPRQGSQPGRIVFVGHSDGIMIGVRILLDPYHRGVVHVANHARLVRYQLSAIDLDVDTNRDGTVQDSEDEEGEDTWEQHRGALYSVNLDRDGQRQVDGVPLPDAIHFGRGGTPVYEDFVIENADDERDIAPLVIRKIADEIPPGYSVILRAAEPEDLRRIHVYKKISSDPMNTAIWGNATGEPDSLQIDITPWVDPASPTFQGNPATGDTEFGIEGLFFRYDGDDVQKQLRFDGYIDFTLELRRAGVVISADSVRVKVAPWIMLSRDQPSEEIWTAALGLQGLIEHGGRDRFADGETFTIGDGDVEKTFEFDTGMRPGVAPGHVPVDLSDVSSASEVGQAIVAAVNEVSDYAILAYVPSSGWPGDSVNGSTGLVMLAHTDVSVSALDVTPPTETVADPRFRIVGMSGVTNQSLLRTEFAEVGYVGLDASGQSQEVIQPDARNQWFQDHVEIGYTQRPGGPKTHVVFRLPYWRGTHTTNPVWPMTHLLGPNTAIFQLGVSLGGSSSDFGGNLEVLPPNRTHPLGRIVMGSQASTKMQQFLISQEVQDPVFDLPVQWLALGHIDEVVSFLANGQVAIADPTMAWELLEGIPVQDRGRSVLFATGTNPESGTASADSKLPNRIETGIDHRLQSWKYIRIYEGAAKGTVAEIETLGDGFITVKRVWKTGSKIVYGTGPEHDINYWRRRKLPTTPDWGALSPQRGDRYVLVEGTQYSQSGTPALVTVAEILADKDFADLNRIGVQGAMHQIRDQLESYTPAGTLTFIKVPSLFFGNRKGATGERFFTGRGVEAFNPGPPNLQEVGGRLYVARQFGPRDETGNDLFEQAIRTALRPVVATTLAEPFRSDQTFGSVAPSSDDVPQGQIEAALVTWDDVLEGLSFAPQADTQQGIVFVDDWDLYHRLKGNLHCGTVVKRSALAFDWWNV